MSFVVKKVLFWDQKEHTQMSSDAAVESRVIIHNNQTIQSIWSVFKLTYIIGTK